VNIIQCQQGTNSWFEAKLGKVSASNFSKVLNKGTSRGLYMRKLAAEKLTGITQTSYTNENMETGLELEGFAREYYGLANSCKIEQVGFIQMNDWVGASPDGLIGKDGLLEIKCPIPSTHIENIIRAKMPTCYIPQVQGQLLVTGRKWCDFISYSPQITSRPFYSIRINRDDKYIKILKVAIEQFVAELKDLIKKITESEI